jgi:hypothetical protein
MSVGSAISKASGAIGTVDHAGDTASGIAQAGAGAAQTAAGSAAINSEGQSENSQNLTSGLNQVATSRQSNTDEETVNLEAAEAKAADEEMKAAIGAMQ